MKTLIENINDSLRVDVLLDGFVEGVTYAIDSGYAVMNRSTGGLADHRQLWANALYNDGGIVVHAHGSNEYTYIDCTSYVGNIVSVRAKNTSYGPGVEFYLPNWNHQSWATADVTGHFADLGYRYDTTYAFIRSIVRATASGGGVWMHDTLGYGIPDWQAVDDSLSVIFGE